MHYNHFTYPELKKLCAERGLGGAGKREELVAKLEAYDLLKAEAKIVLRETRPETEEIKPEQDPPPKSKVFANWDEDGKWVRRPKGFISWEDERRKAG
jgi:hypothetical protein